MLHNYEPVKLKNTVFNRFKTFVVVHSEITPGLKILK